jgi:hypothetical protein
VIVAQFTYEVECAVLDNPPCRKDVTAIHVLFSFYIVSDFFLSLLLHALVFRCRRKFLRECHNDVTSDWATDAGLPTCNSTVLITVTLKAFSYRTTEPQKMRIYEVLESEIWTYKGKVMSEVEVGMYWDLCSSVHCPQSADHSLPSVGEFVYVLLRLWAWHSDEGGRV